MRIGTITFHRALNYGFVLQTYALNKYLRLLGNQVETIDFATTRQACMYRKFSPIKFNGGGVLGLARNVYSLIYSRQFDYKTNSFEKFIKEYIPLSDFKASSSEDLKTKIKSLNYDLYICGSDQIWNTNCGDFARAYLLDFVDDKSCCCSYAPSIGVTKLNTESEKLMIEYLTNFKRISVREKNSSVYLSKIIGRDVETVLDPVFLLEKAEWEKILNPVNIKDEYVLGYYIGDVAGMRKYSKLLAKHYHGKVVVINQNLRDLYIGNRCVKYSAGPREFLWLIKNAAVVCTNSFHAVAFSLIFNKNFYAFVDSNAKGEERPQQRIYNIIELVGLESHIVDRVTCVDININQQIDWDIVNKKLQIATENSKAYIQACLH